MDAVRWGGELAPILRAFQRRCRLTDANLAAWLEMDPARLPALAARRAPEPHGHSLAHDCRLLAHDAGCDAWSLALILRWLRAGG